MQSIWKLLHLSHRHKKPLPEPVAESAFFSTAFVEQGLDASVLVPWEARAVEVGARRLSPSHGTRLLQTLWGQDPSMARLGADDVKRLERFLEFAHVPAGRDVIRQEEYGNFMLVLLAGSMAIDRVQPSGQSLRLAQTEPGEILGEMSLLDSGLRFAACSTLSDCEMAVLSAEALDEMVTQEPALAATFIALLARKLSLLLRAVSAHVGQQTASLAPATPAPHPLKEN